MDREALRSRWLTAEENAHIIGWDFSWMDGHYTQPDTPWSLRDIITAHLQPGHRLLDMETGGGEFLLSLGHPPQKTAATEAYPPNVQLCRERLSPLGVDFRPAAGDGPLPFGDRTFDVVINRHGSFDPKEVYRVLKPGGLFITQQVGGMNDHGLVELLIPGQNRSHSDFNARNIAEDFRRAGFTVETEREAFMPCRFFDVEALIWFARIIVWEFPGFSVDACFDRLLRAQQMIEQQGWVQGLTHRFLLVARKKHQYYYGIAPSAALHRLWADNIARHPGDPHWERWRKQYLYYNTHDMARTYVVLCGDDPVGEGTLLFSPSCSAIRERTVLADDHTVANVNALRILKEHEGQGHISAIVHQMMADARRRGFTRLTIGVEADNARNRAIYRHWGFTDLVLKAKEDGKEILYFAKEI